MRTWELPAPGTPWAMTPSECHARLVGAAGVAVFDGPDDVRKAAERLLGDEFVRQAGAAAGEAAVRSGTYRARMKELLASLDRAATAP